MKKLTEDELSTLRSLNSEYSKMKTHLGELEITKFGIVKEIEAIKTAFGSFESVLIEKYGKDSIVNIETGEVTEAQKQN
jgi:hypothetical protein